MGSLQHLIFALPLFAAASAAASQQSTSNPHIALRNFRNCISERVPLTLPENPVFSVIASRNFRNSHTTPRAILQPTTESQVQHSVSCASRHDLKLCVRSGGHSLIGGSLCNGVLLDIGQMRTVKFSDRRRFHAHIQPGATLGEVLHYLWTSGRRWFASGVCPGVGVTGYIFGGGHGPYEGKLGMACDALLSVRMVDRRGRIVFASRTRNKELFWAMCGAGGGQFGVVVSFKTRTVPSRIYDRGVVFRFKWTDHARAGEVLHKWQSYGEERGRVWFRMEMYRATAETGITGYGACYDVSGQEECLRLLRKAPFFNVPSRTTEFIGKVESALQLHAFFTGAGGWGRRFAPDTHQALLAARYVDSGAANERLYRSAMLSFDPRKNVQAPSREDWQRYADFCRDPGRASIPWHVCELNLFNNAIDTGRNNAFPHRGAHIISHYIIGGGEPMDRLFVYRVMKQLLLKQTTGVYVNYPELQLSKNEYPRMYWGKSLRRLQQVKRRYDPNMLFANPQPIPLS